MIAAAWGQWPIASLSMSLPLWVAVAFLAGVIVGLLASHELAVWSQVRRRGGTLDLVGHDPDDWTQEPPRRPAGGGRHASEREIRAVERELRDHAA